MLLDRRLPLYLCETTWARGVEMWHVEGMKVRDTNLVLEVERRRVRAER